MYNYINNKVGDEMVNEKDTGALINQIREVTRDHIDWIKSQLLKPNNFMMAKGREVWIDVPNSKLKNIVTIPGKGEANYREAWVKVYNLAVDYLEDTLSYACMSGKLDYRTINWPDFDVSNANYARGLEKVLDEFKLKEETKIKEEEEKNKLKVVKSSVVLNPVSTQKIIDAYHNEISKKINVSNDSDNVEFKHAKKEVEDSVLKEPEVEVFENPTVDVDTIENNELIENEPVKPTMEFSFQKILDGDKLTKKDLRNLHDIDSKLVMIPCQDVDNIKAEKMFLENMHVCSDENIMSGAMIYGRATDEKEALYELKKMFKLLDQCDKNFSRCVIYEVNDKFALKNKDSEMRLLSFINAYTMVAEGLSKEGYIPILSMNLTSRRILNDIYGRYKLDSKFEIIYMVLVRELDELAKNDSTILMDPQYDYDVITLRNPKFNSVLEIQEVLSERRKNMALAKAA